MQFPILSITSSSSSSSSSGSSSSSSSDSILTSSSKQSIPPTQARVLSAMNINSVRDAIAKGDANSVARFGAVLKYLPADQIAQYLKFEETADFLSPFENISPGNDRVFTNTTMAYLGIYVQLMDALPKQTFAELFVSTFPSECAYITTEAMDYGLDETLISLSALLHDINTAQLLDRDTSTSENWRKTLTHALTDKFEHYQLHQSFLEILEHGSTETMYRTGLLLHATGVTGSLSNYQTWAIYGDDKPKERIDYFFDLFKKGKEGVIEQYVQLIRLYAACPIAAQHIEEIDNARDKFISFKAALRKTNTSNFLIGRLLPLNSLHAKPGQLKLK